MEFKKWIKDGTNRQWLWWPCCPGFHHARAVRLSGDLPIPLGKVVCESGDLWAAILFYINLVVSTTCKIWEIKVVGGSAWAPRHRRRRRTLYQSSTTSKRWSPIQVFIFAGGLLYRHLTHHCPFFKWSHAGDTLLPKVVGRESIEEGVHPARDVHNMHHCAMEVLEVGKLNSFTSDAAIRWHVVVKEEGVRRRVHDVSYRMLEWSIRKAWWAACAKKGIGGAAGVVVVVSPTPPPPDNNAATSSSA